MNSKKTAISVGVLFLLATASYMLGTGLIDNILNTPDYLSNAFVNKNQIILGVLLQFIDVAAVVGIGVLMFPILKKFNKTVAVGYVATRIIECILLVLGAIGTLLLITVSQSYAQAGTLDASQFQTLGAVLKSQGQLGYQLGMMALGLGSLPFCYLLYQSKLIPRWLSGLGFIGYALLLTWSVLEVFGSSFGLTLIIPGGLFELILPLWLFVKGFNQADDLALKTRGTRLKGGFA